MLPLRPLVSLVVQGSMLFPRDEEGRRRFVIKEAAQWYVREQDKEVRCFLWQEVLAPAGDVVPLLQTTIDAFSGLDMPKAVTEAGKQGAIAGFILATIWGLGQCGEEGSVRKARDVLQQYAKHGMAWDGGPLTRNRDYIKKAWTCYKPVAHLWAAMAQTSSTQDITLFPSLDSAFRFTLQADLAAFLSHAEFLRDFGERHYPRGQKGPLLPPKITWKVPPCFPLPVFDPNVGMPPVAFFTEEALKDRLKNPLLP